MSNKVDNEADLSFTNIDGTKSPLISGGNPNVFSNSKPNEVSAQE